MHLLYKLLYIIIIIKYNNLICGLFNLKLKLKRLAQFAQAAILYRIKDSVVYRIFYITLKYSRSSVFFAG